MKKNVYRILAAAFAMALVMASPSATITSHALGFNPGAHDDTDRGEMPSGYYDHSDSSNNGSSSNESSSSSNSGSSSNESSSSGSSSNESSSSGSSDNGGSYDSGSYDNGGSYDSGSSDNGGSSYSGNTVNNPNDVTVGTTGGQKFRNVMNSDHTVYEVYHCGISRVAFTVTDTEGNAVAYKTVTLEQDKDNNFWYVNITFAEGVDTKGLTLNVTKGDSLYLGSELDVRGIKINGKVVLLTVKTNGFNIDAPEDTTDRGVKPSKK